jgi:signal transduction histidine kinase
MKKYLLILLLFLLITAQKILAQTPDELSTIFEQKDSLFDIVIENDPGQSISLVNELINIGKKLNSDSLLHIAHLNQAEAYNKMEMFDESLKVLYDLLKTSESNSKDKRTIKLLLLIGNSYFQMGDHDKAVTMLKRSKSEAIRLKQYADTIMINLELGLNLVALNKPNEGISIIRANIVAAKKMNDIETICIGLDNLSNAYFELEDYKNSLVYQEEILNYGDFIHRSLEKKAAINQHLAEINIQLKRWDVAQIYVDSATYYAKEIKSNYWLFDCYKNQASILEAKGKYKEALHFHQMYLSAKDSVYKADYDTKMSFIANLYELENKELKINQLTVEHQLTEAKLKGSFLLMAIIALLIGLAFMYSLFKKNRAEKLLQQSIAFQLLQAQEDERRRISGELHDSVGQNMLFLKNKLQSENDIDKGQLLHSVDNALQEIRNISKNLYPNQLEKYGLIAAVDALAEEVHSSTGIFVSSDLEGIDELLNKNVKINFYRIIQEFVNNTLKHAEATSIRITAQQIDDKIELIVQDNGRGFDKSELERKANRTFGLLNMEERIKMLKGNLRIESSPGKGTKSYFTIPV